MTAAAVSLLNQHPRTPLAGAAAQPHWYAVYTCANHEKRVSGQLAERAVEHFLPLYESVRRWRDRRVRLQLPLFPGYLFVRLALSERMRVLQVPSVVRLIGFGEHPVALPESEIETLRTGLGGGLCAQPHPFLTVGRRVQIKGGPLAGLEGFLLCRKSRLRVVVSVDLIQRSMAVEVDAADLIPKPGPAARPRNNSLASL